MYQKAKMEVVEINRMQTRQRKLREGRVYIAEPKNCSRKKMVLGCSRKERFD